MASYTITSRQIDGETVETAADFIFLDSKITADGDCSHEIRRRLFLVGCSLWVAKSRTRQSDFTFTFHYPALEKEMATHSRVPAWRIPGMVEAWWAAIYGVAQSWTWLTRLSSSSSSRLLITFLPRSKRLLISWLQSPSAVILEPPKMKSVTVSVFPHLFAMKWWDWMPWSSFSECWALSQLFHSPLSLSSTGSLVLCVSEVVGISPGNLDSSLCFFQPSVSHDVLCI